jgi:hypothetical protein
MLLSMSKSTFTGQIFTNITRDIINIPSASTFTCACQPIFFQSFARKIPVKSAFDRAPASLSCLCFSADGKITLNPLSRLRTTACSRMSQVNSHWVTHFQRGVSCQTSRSAQVTRRSTMKDPHKSIHFNCPTTTAVASFRMGGGGAKVGQIGQRTPLSFRTGPEGKPENVTFSSMRCSEKGCVFPASPGGHGRCSYHRHQEEEPVLFRSHQPTGMLLDPARILPDDNANDCRRKRDRRRLAAIWEQFQSDGTS